MSDLPVGLSVSGAPGFVPTAFLAVVEYVDPDGNVCSTVVASDGITDARRERLRTALSGKSPGEYAIAGGPKDAQQTYEEIDGT